MVFLGAHVLLSKTNDELQNLNYIDHVGQFACVIHWNYVKKNLNALFTMMFPLHGEVEIKLMSKDCKESLLRFICRF